MGFLGNIIAQPLNGLASGLGVGTASATTNANQPNVDQANAGVKAAQDQQQALLAQLQAQNGIGNQTNVFAQQQQLAAQLQQQALGQGPNPAMDQLNQTTGANIAGQGALMAGQRNAGANAGLMARQIAQQGANTQQQAVGQAATLGANQQIAAQQQLGQQQQAMAGLATNQVGQLQGAQQNFGNMALQNQSNQMGVQANQNNAINGIDQSNSQARSQLVGGLIGAGGQVAASGLGGKAPVKAAHGGVIPGKASVPGDSPKNDTVPARLSPGELVIPRSVVRQGPQAVLAFAKHVLEEDND